MGCEVMKVGWDWMGWNAGGKWVYWMVSNRGCWLAQ